MKLFRKKRSVLVNFFVSYLVILIIPTAIGMIGYVTSARAVKSQVENYNMAMLQQVQRVMDERLANMRQYAMDIAFNPTIQRFLAVPKEKESADYYKMLETTQQLVRYKSVNDFISNLYIYFRKSNIVSTINAGYEPRFFFENILPASQWSYEEWEDIIRAKYINEYMPVYDGEVVESILFLQSLPLQPGDDTQGTLVMTIENDKIRGFLSDINRANKGVVYIVDKKNRIMMCMGDRNLITYNEYDMFSSHNGYSYRDDRGQEIFLAYASSEVTDWAYVSAVPTSVFTSEIIKIRNTVLSIVIAGLILGITLAAVLSKRNTAPIKALVESLKRRAGLAANETSSESEMELIERITSGALAENINIRKELDSQKVVLRNNLLAQLVKGNIPEPMNIDDNFKSLGLKFYSDLFCVVLMDIEGCEDEKLVNDWGLVKFIITNISEELINQNHKGFVLDLEWDKMALLLNFTDIRSSDTEAILLLCREIKKNLLKSFKLRMSIGIGSVHNGYEGISVSFHEASKAIEYKLVKGRDSITAFGELRDTHANYIYSIETELKLIRCIKSEGFEAVKALLMEIFDQNFRNSNPSIDMARCLYFDVMSTAIKLIGDINIDCREIFGPDYNPFKTLEGCGTVDEMHHALEFIYENVCGYFERTEKSANNVIMKNDILKYIENLYADPNMSLVSVAEHFNMNAAYLSYFFKEHMKENFMDYLRRKRIEKAKELLEDTTLSLIDITHAVGYSNSGVLIRNFKKAENMTPGQYREGIGRLLQ